jgi:hypothetical protein
MQTSNKQFYFARIDEIINYIKQLKDCNNKFMVKSQTKFDFIGIIGALLSIKNLCNRLVCESGKLLYLCTYKLSQDHIEHFFSAIRTRGGFNNNPSCRHFIYA